MTALDIALLMMMPWAFWLGRHWSSRVNLLPLRCAQCHRPAEQVWSGKSLCRNCLSHENTTVMPGWQRPPVT